jgi:phosphate transport system protein
MERRMDELLGGLKHQLLKMSALAESMIAYALRLLVERNESYAPTIQKQEHEVNLLQVEIDETCLNIIALHQPTAGDLRFILGAAKTNADLERLADQAVNICQKAVHLIHQPPLAMPEIIPRMGSLATAMVKDALHAYVTRDPVRAREVLARDDELDEMKRVVTRSLVQIMRADSSAVERCLDLVLIARNLERIGDHATNIAENAIFVVEGRDVRHHHDEKSSHQLV